ncbi:MAG: hypothetical protein ACYCPQ_10115 [Elusimicrobiota bacterium]
MIPNDFHTNPPTLSLDFYGFTVKVQSSNAEILINIKRDFIYFLADQDTDDSPAACRWNLLDRHSPREINRGVLPILKTSQFTVYRQGKLRTIFYHDGPISLFNAATQEGTIFCADAQRLHELAFLGILSRAGEALDHRGLHRVHALGFEVGGDAGLLLLASGGGKSALALELLRSAPGIRFLSEDTPLLCRHGSMHPFPLRWSFKPDADLRWVSLEFIRPFLRKRYGAKRLLDLDAVHGRIGASSPLRWIFVGARRDQEPSRIIPLSKTRTILPLFKNMALGIGVPQMAEYMLGFGPADILRLGAIASSRLKVAAHALERSRVFSFELGPTPEQAAQTLLNLVSHDSKQR